MRRLKLTVEFDGTDFHGFQVQTKTGERTVQAVVQRAFAQLPGKHLPLRSAGRTDAGVHALAHVAHIDTDTPVVTEQLQRALNAHLPPDVRILSVQDVPNSFEAQYSCLYRRYLYRMRFYRDDLSLNTLDRNRVLPLYRDLDVAVMQAAATKFEGTRDFSALATQETRSPVKTVYLCRLDAVGRDLSLHVAADGFLRGMVRAIVGMLIRVGEGRLALENVEKILASKDRRQAWENAPPFGLYFVEAGYEPWDGEKGRRKKEEERKG